MSIIPKVGSKEEKEILLKSHKIEQYKKLPVKNIFSNIQPPVIIDPIDLKHISKEPKVV